MIIIYRLISEFSDVQYYFSRVLLEFFGGKYANQSEQFYLKSSCHVLVIIVFLITQYLRGSKLGILQVLLNLHNNFIQQRVINQGTDLKTNQIGREDRRWVLISSVYYLILPIFSLFDHETIITTPQTQRLHKKDISTTMFIGEFEAFFEVSLDS